MLINNLHSKYNPLYFLAALGAGGLAVALFTFPNFLLPHKGYAMITFDHIYPMITEGSAIKSGLILFTLIAIALLSILHFRLLFWNISEYRKFKKTEAFTALKNSNREVALMAVPLTLAMTVNVSFILGALFVPGLWSVVEYLFPVAIGSFLIIGIYALKILGDYFSRIFIKGNFNFAENNNFSQMIAVFAFTMIAVGLAAPGAMSHIKIVNGIGMFLSVFFLSIAIILGVIKLTISFKSTLKHGIDKGSSATLWIMIPILTLMGITIIRISMGLHHSLEAPLSNSSFFIITSVIISLQIFIGLIGYKVMKAVGYFRDHSQGDSANAGSFALVCPGVAFVVFAGFFLSYGLVRNGLIETLSTAHIILLIPVVLVLLQTLRVFFRLLCKVTACGPCKQANCTV